VCVCVCLSVLYHIYKLSKCLPYAVKLFWVPGHSGIYGNEQADQLAKAASFKSYVGFEPVLPVSTSVVQSQLQAWTLRETQTR